MFIKGGSTIQKSRALSKVIVLRAGEVKLVGRTHLTVSLPNGRPLHVPIAQLSVDARTLVLTLLKEGRNHRRTSSTPARPRISRRFRQSTTYRLTNAA